MTSIALCFCLFLVCVGVFGVASPARLLALVRRLVTPRGLYLVAVIRVAMGVVLYLAAPESRAPEAIRGVGVFVFVVGVITPFFGLERFGSLLDWWAAIDETFLRAWAALVLGLGVLLAWAVAG